MSLRATLLCCLIIATLLVSLTGSAQSETNFAPPVAVLDTSCPTVQNTPYFTLVYGQISTNGSPSAVGTIVQARTPRGDIAGCEVISSGGYFGVMYVYGEDSQVTPSIPGMRNGEAISFYIDGLPASSTPTLTWLNDKDLHDVSLSVTPSQPPTARFTATPLSGPAPLQVQFSNTSTGTYTQSSWNFSDGSALDATVSPIHTFTSKGVYQVSLSVTGPGGSNSTNQTITVYAPISVNFSANPTRGKAPLTVNFTSTVSGDATSLSWNFGDASPLNSQANPSHVYATAGTYTVTLTAAGPGESKNTSKTVTVDPAQKYIYIPAVRK